MNANPYIRQFDFEQAAEACGRPPQTLRSWSNHDWLRLGQDDVEGYQGKAAKLSLATVFRIAIAAELLDYGFRGRDAFDAATEFSDVGKGRLPGTLFKSGLTVLIARKPSKQSRKSKRIPLGPNPTAEVVNIQKGIPAEQFSRLRPDGASFVTVCCNYVCERVAAKLGMEVVYDDGNAA
jgi:hypothetical protein